MNFFTTAYDYKMLDVEQRCHVFATRLRHVKKNKFLGITYSEKQDGSDDLIFLDAKSANSTLHNYLVCCGDIVEVEEVPENTVLRALTLAMFYKNIFEYVDKDGVSELMEKADRIEQIYTRNFGEKKAEAIKDKVKKVYDVTFNRFMI